ncbi:hypothetical protein Anapl_04540 [Anas platyrhynchos]|uniref:Uncharacterized protein n=1 Tax=Anas platyrhynchos TaxID=8839 RepID=R0LYM0_ANAPL|nr:hypothetical protein Anapl_04540 [Anas platyrhynchos]
MLKTDSFMTIVLPSPVPHGLVGRAGGVCVSPLALLTSEAFEGSRWSDVLYCSSANHLFKTTEDFANTFKICNLLYLWEAAKIASWQEMLEEAAPCAMGSKETSGEGKGSAFGNFRIFCHTEGATQATPDLLPEGAAGAHLSVKVTSAWDIQQA